MVTEVNMSIELKKPITSLSELNCDNCIHYQKLPLVKESCINPDGNNWEQGKDDCCSRGMWFVTIKHNSGDEVELYSYPFVMRKFMQEVGNATR